MKRKGMFVYALGVTSLLALPVQAAVNVCTHPVSDPVYVREFDATYEQHRLWEGPARKCETCHEIFDEDLTAGAWEDHSWVIDWDHPDDIGHGLVFYEAECSVCGYTDTLANP